jgi:hypothetical protein
MLTLKIKLSLIGLIILSFLIISCQRSPVPTSIVPTRTDPVFDDSDMVDEVTDNPGDEAQPNDLAGEDSGEIEQQSEQAPESSPTPDYTPTPDLRLPPDKWREWPVIPEVSPNAIAIYNSGIAKGNLPGRFSKIGDCQMVKAVMGIYDLPNRYTLSPEYEYLQSTIDNFSGSFNRDGMAVYGGFNAATVLSPIWANPEVCEPGENPIECEFRVHQPSIVLISLEVWWDGRSPERYEQYVRRIIEYSIEQGVVPILSTKADNVEGDHSINRTTAELAYEYDIPLWNFWAAVQDLPYQGIDPERDGFHITVDAWNRRSFTALEAIHAVYSAAAQPQGTSQDIIDDSQEEMSDQTDEELVSSLVFGTMDIPPYDMDGIIFFELIETVEGQSMPAGIYSLTLNKGDLVYEFPAGANIISENMQFGFFIEDAGNYQFLNQAGKVLDVTGVDLTNRSIFMLSPKEFLLVQHQKGGVIDLSYGVINELGVVSEAFFDISGLPGEITAVLAATKDIIILTIGDCETGKCTYFSIENYLVPDEAYLIEMEPFDYPSIQQESGIMAFWRNISGSDNLNLINLKEHSNEKYLGLYGNIFLDQAWQNSENTYSAVKMERSDYYGRATDILHYVINADTNIIKEYPPLLGLNPVIGWSPDNQFLITSVTQVGESGDSTIVIRIINTSSGQEAFLDADLGMTSDTFIAITKLIWLDPTKEQE